jgi:hypothetical protein
MTHSHRPFTTTSRQTNDENAPATNSRDLTQLATAINERSEAERELESQAFDHRVGTGKLLIEARAKVKEQGLKWEAWCAGNIKRHQGDIRKLMRLASAENPREARQTEKAKNREGVRRTRENKTGERAYVSALSVDGTDGGASLVSVPGAKGKDATFSISAPGEGASAQLAATLVQPAQPEGAAALAAAESQPRQSEAGQPAAAEPEFQQSEVVRPEATQVEPENRGVARLSAALPKGHQEAVVALDTGRQLIDLLMPVVLRGEGEIPEEAVILDLLKFLGLYDFADRLSKRPRKPIDRAHAAVAEAQGADHNPSWSSHLMRVDFGPKARIKHLSGEDGTEFPGAIKRMAKGHIKIMYRRGKPKGNGQGQSVTKGNGQGKPARTSAPKREPKNDARGK